MPFSSVLLAMNRLTPISRGRDSFRPDWETLGEARLTGIGLALTCEGRAAAVF